ncbi:MAG TPA: hypothetical protein VNJ04_11965 [Gemmatimonadaceae bacterium]|nr:hypothetical protein [Gemmatimonadaceae bacterium]
MTPEEQVELRVILAHPFFALGREFQWDERQLAAARKLIDVTLIRLEEVFDSRGVGAKRAAEEREGI